MIWDHLNNYSFIDDENIFRENVAASMPYNVDILPSTIWYKNEFRHFNFTGFNQCPMIEICVRNNTADHTTVCINYNVNSNAPNSAELINIFKHGLCLMYSQNLDAFESFLQNYSKIENEDEEYRLYQFMKQFYEDIIEFVNNQQCYVLK
jgi:hypothetical protein